MIMTRLKNPRKCDVCPCVYWIRAGQFEGRAMCALAERINHNKGTPEPYLVDENTKPDWCPMFDTIVPENCPHCGKPIFEGSDQDG